MSCDDRLCLFLCDADADWLVRIGLLRYMFDDAMLMLNEYMQEILYDAWSNDGEARNVELYDACLVAFDFSGNFMDNAGW